MGEHTIDFDEKTHTYRIGSKKIPGVSEILKKVGLVKSYEGIDPYFAQRGVATHLANELWLNGKLDELSLDPQIVPFHKAFRKYVEKTGYKPRDVEKVYYHPELAYACRIDYYGDGLLIDAKCTKSHDRGADYQLCLQAAAIEANGAAVTQMQILELHEDGTYDPYEYTVDRDIAPAIMKLYRRKVG